MGSEAEFVFQNVLHPGRGAEQSAPDHEPVSVPIEMKTGGARPFILRESRGELRHLSDVAAQVRRQNVNAQGFEGPLSRRCRPEDLQFCPGYAGMGSRCVTAWSISDQG
jgi:hypothetical protein